MRVLLRATLEPTTPHPTAMADARHTPPRDAPPPDPADGWINDPGEAAVMYRRLAVHVIERAFKDITASTCPSGDRQSAREFLAGSRMLFHWCRVASLDPHRVMARAATLGKPL